MKAHHVISAAAFSLLALAGTASAQTTSSQSQGSVTVTTNSASTTPAAGTSAAFLGTVTLTATQQGDAGNVSIASLPLALTTANGASPGNLNGCQLINPSGAALNTGANAQSGASNSNTFTFDTPLLLSGGQSIALTIRCNVDSATQSGGSFQFVAGMPVFTSSLGVNLNAAPSARIGAQDTLLALISLNGSRSGSATQISSIPLSVSFGNGATVQNLSDCRVRNLSNLTAPLNNGSNAIGIVQGPNVIPLDVPLQIGANSSATLALTCDVSSTAPLSGTVNVSVAPSDFKPTVVGTGASVTPTTGIGANGQLGSTSGIISFTNTGSVIPTVPGVPNTGTDSSSTIMLLGISGLIAVFGLFLARRLSSVR